MHACTDTHTHKTHTHTQTHTHRDIGRHTGTDTHTDTHAHAHTHTHTHTHTLSRTELIKFLKVEEVGFESGLERIDSWSIFYVKCQWTPDRKAKMRVGMTTFLPCIYRVEAGGSTRVKRSRRRVKMQEIRKMRRSSWWCWIRGRQSCKKYKFWRVTSETVWELVCTLEGAWTTRQAAQFCVLWSLEIKESGRPAKRELQ